MYTACLRASFNDLKGLGRLLEEVILTHAEPVNIESGHQGLVLKV